MNKFVYNQPKFLIHKAKFEIPTKLAGLLEKYSAKQIQAKLCIFLLKKKKKNPTNFQAKIGTIKSNPKIFP